MRVLAMRGAHVIGTARTMDKGREACGMAACTDAIRAMKVDIDMLILNTGIVLDDWQQMNGLDKQFVVNHPGSRPGPTKRSSNRPRDGCEAVASVGGVDKPLHHLVISQKLTWMELEFRATG